MKIMQSKYGGVLCPECGKEIDKGVMIAYGKIGRQRSGKAYHEACWTKIETRIALDDQDLACYAHGGY